MQPARLLRRVSIQDAGNSLSTNRMLLRHEFVIEVKASDRLENKRFTAFGATYPTCSP
jgi:hypothetical protein